MARSRAAIERGVQSVRLHSSTRNPPGRGNHIETVLAMRTLLPNPITT
jgi:hypothetical protein